MNIWIPAHLNLTHCFFHVVFIFPFRIQKNMGKNMGQEIRVDPMIGSIGVVISRALENKGIKHVFGAYSDRAIVIGLDFMSLTKQLLLDVDLTGYDVRVEDGHLFLIRSGGVSQEEVDKVNLELTRRLTKLGVDARAYITSDNASVLVANLNDVALKILESTLEIAKAKVGNKMRNVRVKYGNDGKWGYMVVYKKSEKVKDEIKKDELMDLL
jgi:hypothetical protein